MTDDAAATDAGIVQIENGRLQGVPSRLPGVRAYKGIPYGATTAGSGRWRPPQPVDDWADVRVAADFGDAAPQLHDTAGQSTSEDCLNLNVWTPADGSPEPRPVFVWIHGGRFSFGGGYEAVYDGSALASKGVVVVTINMRLGVFGYLSTPELSAESPSGSSGNYGLLDAIAALTWVKKNIAAFGGDPSRVTVGGHSSGGATTLDLVYSPLAEGLFQQVWVESAAYFPTDPANGSLAPSYRERIQAEADGVAYAAARGAHTVEQLRDLPLETLLAGSDGDDPNVAGNPPPPLFRPVLDGWVLPATYLEALTSGRFNKVAVVTGNNRDESGAAYRPQGNLESYEAYAQTKFGPTAAGFLSLYPATTDEEARLQRNESIREATRTSTWLWGALFGQHSDRPVYTYYWEHVPPGSDGEARGAFHGSEMIYVFNNLDVQDLPWSAEDRAIAERLSDHLVAYAATGDPNLDEPGSWTPVSGSEPRTFAIGDRWEPFDLSTTDRVEFVRNYLRAQPAW